MSETSAIVDDAANHRFLLESEGQEAELVYRHNGRRLVLIHTGVPEALSGQGIGGRLVERAVEEARQESLVLVPACPYARKWLESHPDVAAGVSIDWETTEPPAVLTEEDPRHG